MLIPPVAATGGAPSPRCLIVDDSQVVRKVARRLLEKHGVQVQEAGSGYEALRICRQALPTCILLDWNMPGMSGIEFLQNLCVCVDREKPIILFCTTETDLAAAKTAASFGADGYILKPFDEVMLIDKFCELGLKLPARSDPLVSA